MERYRATRYSEEALAAATEVYNTAISMARLSNVKASLYKFVSVTTTILVIASGTIIGVLSLQNNDPGATYTAAVLGFATSGVKTLTSIFDIERRGVIMKEMSNELRKIARDLDRDRLDRSLTETELLNKITHAYGRIDQIDLKIYNENLVSRDMKGMTSMRRRVLASYEGYSSSSSEEIIRPKHVSGRAEIVPPVVVPTPQIENPIVITIPRDDDAVAVDVDTEGDD